MFRVNPDALYQYFQERADNMFKQANLKNNKKKNNNKKNVIVLFCEHSHDHEIN